MRVSVSDAVRAGPTWSRIVWKERFTQQETFGRQPSPVSVMVYIYPLKYAWFARPAPNVWITLAIAAVLIVWAYVLYRGKVNKLKDRFGSDFKGSLRVCAKISAYQDNDDPFYAMLRLCSKSMFFLALLQLSYHVGFLAMMGLVVIESSLDSIRVFLAYHNCQSLRDMTLVTSRNEARSLKQASAKLEPLNVYEDFTRPQSIASMVFAVQFLLIGLVMYDSYRTEKRSCFDGNEGCEIFSSLGSWCLYVMGMMMAVVFYIGPRNAYGSNKAQNPIYWLRCFQMTKQSRSVVSWKDPATDEIKTMRLARDDVVIWMRFIMSFVINGIGFGFLLHVLPIQVASQSAIIGVVFRAVGMIYLVDLDNTTGSTMTLVPQSSNAKIEEGSSNRKTAKEGYSSVAEITASAEFELEKQNIIADAVKEVQARLEALTGITSSESNGSAKVQSITHALLLSAKNTAKDDTKEGATEDTPLV